MDISYDSNVAWNKAMASSWPSAFKYLTLLWDAGGDVFIRGPLGPVYPIHVCTLKISFDRTYIVHIYYIQESIYSNSHKKYTNDDNNTYITTIT